MLKIVTATTPKELRKFAKFNIELYKGNPYAVPQLIVDEVNTLTPSKNPAFEFCEAQCFLCYKDDKIVGRIAAIINHKANQTWGTKHGRFGFIDFIEDFEVAQALIQTAEDWVKERGMTSLEGPLGFTDLDQEGMLIEGFDQLGTMATIYNYPYYPQFMERMGFTKAADWVEHKVHTPDVLQARIAKVAGIVEARTGVRQLQVKSNKELIAQGWGTQIFDLTNTAFAHLYGYSALSSAQKDYYVKQYLPMVRLELLTMVVDKDNKLIAYGLGLPSLSRALQKARGKMFPFGFIHLLRALKAKKSDIIDLMLIAIHPDWQGKGVNAVIMKYFIQNMIKMKCTYAESNPELESNSQIKDQWSDFTTENHKRRRAFIREIK